MENKDILVERARSGDPDAFAALYADIYKDLYRYALYTLGRREDAEDVVMDTVTDAWKQIGSLREAGAFRGWMFRILSNKCSMVLKSYLVKTEELPEELPGEVPDHADHVLARQMLESLTGEERTIITLHLFSGCTSREIGELLGMNPVTVRSKEFRALQRLRAQFAT